MIKVANQKVINRLAFKSFKANKTRNMVAIIAIALTTILFTTLFTIGMGMVETFQNETMRQAGGSAHASLKNLSKEEYDKLKTHPLIKEIGCNIFVDAVKNKELIKRHTEIWYSDDVGAKLGFTTPTTGKMPEAENEIVMDTVTLDLLGVPQKIGQKVTLDYSIKGKEYSKQFIISGFYKGDPAFSAGMVLVSHKFIDVALVGIHPNYKKDSDLAGTIRADVMFKNSTNIEQNIKKVITESGYSINEKDSNNISYGVNWAYLSTNYAQDPQTIIGILLATVLIIFTGYLIIYNIFQISVIKDIRLYGLLKTIGTTSKQIKCMIRMQTLLLSAMGIPFGLIIGYVLGKNLLPLIINVSNYSGRATVSLNPIIFLGATVFSLITVFIGYRKPGKIAAKVSPVEAVRYSGVSINFKKVIKKSTDGGKLYKMAYSNLGRNKKRTAIVVISMSLSLILLNTVFTISKGFDMNKFISKFVQSDYLIANAKYMNSNFHSSEDALSQDFINAVTSQKGFKDGGKVYFKYGMLQSEKLKGGLQLYGMDDFPLSQLDIVEGKFDQEKFKTGRYIIEGLEEDDNGNIYSQNSDMKIGEKVKIKVDDVFHEYEVMAKCRVKNGNYVRWVLGNKNSDGTFSKDSFAYLPANEFCKIVSAPAVMNYQFNMNSTDMTAMETFIKKYTKNVEPTMNYESKAVFMDSFKQMQSMIMTVGGALSLIIGIIGILNFINSMLTSIIARRQELAMLQSIGMTDKQLHKLLIYEGVFYAFLTIITSFIFSILFSIGIIDRIVSKLWFFKYKFVIIPLLSSYPVLLILSIIIPFAAYHGVNKRSIVERLREAE